MRRLPFFIWLIVAGCGDQRDSSTLPVIIAASVSVVGVQAGAPPRRYTCDEGRCSVVTLDAPAAGATQVRAIHAEHYAALLRFFDCYDIPWQEGAPLAASGVTVEVRRADGPSVWWQPDLRTDSRWEIANQWLIMWANAMAGRPLSFRSTERRYRFTIGEPDDAPATAPSQPSE